MGSENPKINLRPLDKKHNRAAFSCGAKELDSYLREFAGQDIRKNAAVVHVATFEGSDEILGFYTLNNFSIEAETIPGEFTKKAPGYNVIPAIMIGRLAVNEKFHKQKFGEFLLFDALSASVRVSKSSGLWAVVVDVKEGKNSFYGKYGFIEFPSNPRRMFIPIGTVKKLLDEL